MKKEAGKADFLQAERGGEGERERGGTALCSVDLVNTTPGIFIRKYYSRVSCRA